MLPSTVQIQQLHAFPNKKLSSKMPNTKQKTQMTLVEANLHKNNALLQKKMKDNVAIIRNNFILYHNNSHIYVSIRMLP